jgi:LysM repeat protein
MSTLSISPTFVAPRASSRALSRPTQAPVRLTRRGRVVVVIAALTLLLLSAFFLGSVAVGSETSGHAEPTEIVMVGTGDTLWGIASGINTDGDVRSTMRKIESLNALDSVALSAGQKLRVPVSDD